MKPATLMNILRTAKTWQELEKLLEEEKTMNTQVTVKFPSGASFTGTWDEIQKLEPVLGKVAIPHYHYLSSTHGLLRISEMESTHIRNSALKMLNNPTLDKIDLATLKSFVDELYGRI